MVCKGSGKRATLQCPYHAWTYGLDGRLLAAPRSEREGGIESEELGLVPLRLETRGPFVFVNQDPSGSYDPEGEVEWGQFHLLFPGTVVNVMPGRPNLSIGPIVPLAPERTYRFLDYFVAPDADDAWVEEALAFDAQVSAEDRVLVERVQQGVRSALIEEDRLLPESERLVAHFQSLRCRRPGLTTSVVRARMSRFG